MSSNSLLHTLLEFSAQISLSHYTKSFLKTDLSDHYTFNATHITCIQYVFFKHAVNKWLSLCIFLAPTICTLQDKTHGQKTKTKKPSRFVTTPENRPKKQGFLRRKYRQCRYYVRSQDSCYLKFPTCEQNDNKTESCISGASVCASVVILLLTSGKL